MMYNDTAAPNRYHVGGGGEGFEGCFGCHPTRCPILMLQEHFWSLDETETKTRPVLTIQIWDNDLFSPDDYLGETTSHA